MHHSLIGIGLNMAAKYPELHDLITDIRHSIDRVRTVSAMNYCSNFTDLNSFFDTFDHSREMLEQLCIQTTSTPGIEDMPKYLDALSEAFHQDQWALVMLKAGYVYLKEKSFMPILDMLTEAALMANAPSNLRIITLRMHQMLNITPKQTLLADDNLHLHNDDLARLQSAVDQYKALHKHLPASLNEAISENDKVMISKLLLPLTIDPQTGEVITEELLRRRYLSERRQDHMQTVERFTPEAFEEPAN
jgi:hypothetical protein